MLRAQAKEVSAAQRRARPTRRPTYRDQTGIATAFPTCVDQPDWLFKMSHPLAQSLTSGEAWSAPLPVQTAPVSQGLDGLRDLGLQGRWREVAKRCASTTASDTTTVLATAAFHVLALLKLKMADQAARELAKLGSFDDPAYNASKSHGSVSLVPFALRVLQAEVSWQLGRQQEAVGQLYALLAWLRGQQAAATDVTRAGSHDQVQRARHRDVAFNLVNKHCRLRQYASALSLLNKLLSADDGDAEAWVEVGAVQALLGDVAAAQRTLRHVEQLLAPVQAPAEERPRHQALLHRNRGLVAFLQRDYRGAAKEYAAALAANPGDAAALNNHALVLMYCCQLGEAVAELEAGFARMPTTLMQEAVVLNLASLYELAASPEHLAAKRRMAECVAAAATDDFDLACTKVSGA